MFEIIGIVAVSTAAAWLAFAVTVGTLSHLGCWSKMEIGAIIPLTISGDARSKAAFAAPLHAASANHFRSLRAFSTLKTS